MHQPAASPNFRCLFIDCDLRRGARAPLRRRLSQGEDWWDMWSFEKPHDHTCGCAYSVSEARLWVWRGAEAMTTEEFFLEKPAHLSRCVVYASQQRGEDRVPLSLHHAVRSGRGFCSALGINSQPRAATDRWLAGLLLSHPVGPFTEHLLCTTHCLLTLYWS